jgi:hypothetical protein
MAKKSTNVQKIDIDCIDLKPPEEMIRNPLPTEIESIIQLSFFGFRAKWVKKMRFSKKKD